VPGAVFSFHGLAFVPTSFGAATISPLRVDLEGPVARRRECSPGWEWTAHSGPRLRKSVADTIDLSVTRWPCRARCVQLQVSLSGAHPQAFSQHGPRGSERRATDRPPATTRRGLGPETLTIPFDAEIGISREFRSEFAKGRDLDSSDHCSTS
jgi:hypothetical protein